MRRNSANSASGLKTAITIVISYEGDKIVAIWQQYKRVLCIFSLRMRKNSYLGASGKKSDPAIRSRKSHNNPSLPYKGGLVYEYPMNPLDSPLFFVT